VHLCESSADILHSVGMWTAFHIFTHTHTHSAGSIESMLTLL